MTDKLILELYTRPTCSDCQQAKEFLALNQIPYVDKDVSKDLKLEDDLKTISGTRIVPSFVFYKKNIWGKKKIHKNIIGFEPNKKEIMELLNVEAVQ
ncbi:glutaredoxin family protein [Cytobacillus sp. Hm23]